MPFSGQLSVAGGRLWNTGILPAPPIAAENFDIVAPSTLFGPCPHAGRMPAFHHQPTMNWQDNILTTNDQISQLLKETKRIAVLGIKPESRFSQPAFYVPKYMQQAGFEIVPVPVYYPDVTEILGEPVYRDLREVPGEIDMVNVFRRDVDIPQHVDEIIAARPKSVWIQLGIRNDAAAEAFAREGIKVVQNLCLMVEHRALV